MGGLLLCVSLFAQVKVIDMSVMRARHAVDTLVQNDQYLDGRSDTLDTRLDSLSFIDASDSTAVFTTIDVDSAKITILNYMPPHGAMNFADSATVIALTVNVWTKVTGPAGDLFVVRDQDGLTIAGDSITITTPGDYMMWLSFSFDGTTNANFHIAVYLNGVITDWEMHRKTSTNDTGNASMPTYLEHLVAGDDISIWIENTGNSNDATMVSGQIVIKMLHQD